MSYIKRSWGESLLRRFAFAAVAVLALFVGPLATGRALAAKNADLTAMTNADRAAARLMALSTANDLQSLAQRRAGEMARSGRLAHTSNLGSKVSGWKRVGENVGKGPDVREIHTAFMNSPSHRQNILDAGFTQLGVGVAVDKRQQLYVAVIFREPSGAATTSAPPPPSTTPTSRAAAAPRPKPTTTTAHAPTKTTTRPPTTTTTMPPAPPPAPPVEALAAPPVEPPPPPPVETTTTTTPRPIFTNRDFLAQNFSDRVEVAAATTFPARPVRPVAPIVVAAVLVAVMGLSVGRVWVTTAARVESRRPDGRRNRA
jgi:Cysteine-rich secretory protein family